MGKTRAPVTLDVSQHINGPFLTLDAVAAVGRDTVLELCKLGYIFWGDHSKRTYFSFQELQRRHANGVPWRYSLISDMSRPYDAKITRVHYGRVRIANYTTCFIVLDTFTRELYYAPTLVDAFEIAVSVIHFFPNSRAIPPLESGHVLKRFQPEPVHADIVSLTASEITSVWVETGDVQVSLDRTVSLTLADAVSILMGHAPSTKFLADVAMTYPQALMASYGAALVCYDPVGTQIAPAQSVVSLALTQDIQPRDAFEQFAESRMVGRWRIVAGWGYRMMQSALPDINMVAAIDLALAQSGSPEVTRATLAQIIAQSAAPHDGSSPDDTP